MNILSRANLEMHKERPRTPRDKVLTLWQPEPDFIHCCVQSCGCRYSRNAGACIMCDYGIGCNVEPDELANALEQQLAPKIPYTKRMLFGTYGSILDVLPTFVRSVLECGSFHSRQSLSFATPPCRFL